MAWEDAPSHVCRGGDKRAMAFCCPPVKPCPIVFALEDAGISAQEYVEIKENFGKKPASEKVKEPVSAPWSGVVNLPNHVHYEIWCYAGST